jgi:hypothetical protein
MLPMKQRPRIYYTQAQKTMMWERWQKGDSLHRGQEAYASVVTAADCWVAEAYLPG